MDMLFHYAQQVATFKTCFDDSLKNILLGRALSGKCDDCIISVRCNQDMPDATCATNAFPLKQENYSRIPCDPCPTPFLKFLVPLIVINFPVAAPFRRCYP